MNPESRQKLIEKAVSFYQKSFANTSEAKSFMEKHGVTDNRIFEKHRIGYADGSLLKALPSKGKILNDLKEAGIIIDNKECFQGCITIPILDEEKRIIDIAGFHLQTDECLMLYGSPITLREALGVSEEACKSIPAKAGMICTIGNRQYELIDLEKDRRRLKATIRFTKNGKFHIDTLNLYSAKETRQFQQDICLRFDEVPETIQEDISKIIQQAESNDSAMEQAEKTIVESPYTDEAIAYGKSSDLIERILTDFEACGLVGEENNKILCYLAMTSRKMTNPLNVMILSSSGAGKSKLQDTVLSFVPPEDLIKLTSLSGKALFYKESNSLKHKVLALEEDKGANEASYAIRNIISSSMLTTESTIRDNATGKITTMNNVVEGPVSVFITSTNPDTDAETKSRFFVIGIDESHEQTKRIIEYQKHLRSLEGLQKKKDASNVIELHRTFQRMFKSYRIVNPHVHALPPTGRHMQSRRTHEQMLNLIDAVCFLRQMQKEIHTLKIEEQELTYIEVDSTDVEIAVKLADDLLCAMNDLSNPAQDLLELIGNYTKEHGKSFTRRELREYTGWSQTRLRTYLQELYAYEYVVQSVCSGKLKRYQLVDSPSATVKSQKVLSDISDNIRVLSEPKNKANPLKDKK